MSFLGARRGGRSEAAVRAGRKVWRRYAFLLTSSLIVFACGQHDEVQPVDPASPASSPTSAASAPPWPRSAPTLQAAKQPPPACKAAILNVGATPGMAPGAAVTLGVAASCSGPTVEYSFSYAPSDDSAHPVQLRDFAASPTFVWGTAGVAPGTYSLLAQARESGSASVATASGKVSLGTTPNVDLPVALNGARDSKLLPSVAAKPAPDFAGGIQAKSLGSSALTTYPLSADGKYYNVNLLHRNFLPPTANATFANGAYQLGQAAPPFVFDGRDSAFTAVTSTPGDPNATVTLTVDMGQYYLVGAIHPLYQPFGGGYPFSQRIRLATKLGPNADWQTVVDGPVTPADTTLSLVQPAAGRYLELTMIGNGGNLLELFVYPSALTSPPPTSADGYDLSSIGASSTVNDNFFAPGLVWPQTWPVGAFYPKSVANGGTESDAVATVDLGAKYDVSQLSLGFFWSTPWVNGGRIEVGATPGAFSTVYDSGTGQPFTQWPVLPDFSFPTQPVQYIRATDYFTPGVGASAGTLWSLQAFQTPPPHVGYYALSADGKYFAVNLARRPTGDSQPSASVVYVNGVTPPWSPQSQIAGNAIDGDDDSLVLWTNGAADPAASVTLTVDLKQAESIGAIRQFYNSVPLSSSIRVAETLEGPWTQVLVDTATTVNDFTSSFDAVSAQYVELTMKGTPTGGFANLLELQVFPSSATDPAPSSGSHLDLTYLTGMTTSVNANMGQNGGASVHSDAGGPGYYVKTAAQGATGDATLTLDLGQQYQISELILSWFGSQTWPAGGKVDVDDGSGTWVQVFDSGRGTPLGSAADGSQRIPVGAAHAARYVRITGYFDPNAAQGLLTNIELFGDSSCATTCSGKHCGDDLSDGCGGRCAPVCGTGAVGCGSDTDCQTGLICSGISRGSPTANTCEPVAPHCSNGILDADESDIDCGGTGCPVCATEKHCNSRDDCNRFEFCSDVGVCEPDSTACDPAAKSNCRPTCPCDTGSQCVTDQDCQGELICALGMGPAFARPRGTNACVKRFCTTSPSQGCGYTGAPCGSCDDAVPCTRDGDCPGGEVCTNGKGNSVNASAPNVCLPAECQTAQAECGDSSSKCGRCACTPNCSAKKCGDDPSDGCGGNCTGFCGDRQPDCQKDADCPGGGACIQGGGPRLGLPASVNVCLPRICLDPNPEVATCGSVADVCGICQAVPPGLCVNRTCGFSPSYGMQCGPTDVPCVQGNPVRAFSNLDLNLSSSARGGARPVTVPALTVTEPVDDNNQEPGALAGSFEVDPRGNGTYTIPIIVPPGRAGMRPEISLSYNSRGGNGIAGVGWSVSGLSTIARCPKTVATDGVMAPVRYDDTDALCLDGARLVQFSTGAPFRSGAEYRTEIDTFQKILVVSSEDGIFFRAFLKNGQIREYGGTGNEKLYREAIPGTLVPRAWGLSRIEDRAGNMVAFTYGKLQNTESRRSADVTQDTLEFFPDEIAYGGVDNEFGSSDSRIHVKFDYSDHRADYMEGFTSSGARITRTKRLKTIRTLIGDQPIRSYELAYKYAATGLGESFDQDSTGPSRLDTVQECSSKNGVRACTPATALSYTDERGFAPNTVVVPEPSLRGPLFTMDANGDGLADFVAVGDGTRPATILVSKGRRPNIEFTHFTITPPAVGETPCFSQASVVDTDGDGRDDLVDLCPHPRGSLSKPEAEHYYRIYKFRGDGQLSEAVSVTVEGLSANKPRAFIVDADGDGVADLFECADTDAKATRGEVRFFAGHRGGGPAFDKNPSGVISADAMVGNCGTYDFPKDNQRPIRIGPSPITVQDVTGDGVPDLLIQQTTPEAAGESLVGTSVWARYVLGDGGVARWETVWNTLTSADVWNDPSRFKFVDVNGDGLKDLITLQSTPQIAINAGAQLDGQLLSEGSPFAPNTDPKLIARFTKYTLMNSISLDYDGDGAEDLLRLLEPVSGGPAGHWLWDRANTDAARYGTLKLDTAPLSLTDPTSFSLNVQPNIDPPKDGGGTHPGFSLGDVDGDGSVDLVQLRNGGGVAVTFGRFGHENLLATVVDGLGKRIEVKYEAQSRFSDSSTTPTYRVAAPEQFPNPLDPGPCVTDGNTVCSKHVGPVVSSFRVLQTAKGVLSNRPDVGYHFRYEDARFGLFGRGWLGFGKTTIEKVWGTFPETPIDVTEVRRDNQTFVASGHLFPFAGRETSRVTTTPLAQSAIESHPSKRRETTTQQWEVGTSTKNAPFPFVRSHVRQTDEVLDTGDVLPITTVSTSVKRINGYGGVEQSDTTIQSNGAKLSTQTVTVDFDLRPDPWLIALPKRRSITEHVIGTTSGKPREEHVVSWTFDADGLLQTITREPDADESSGLKLVTTLDRFQDVNRNIRTVTTQGSWEDGDQTTRGTRSVSFQYDADGISPRRVIRHQGDDCAVNPALDDATDAGFGSTCLIHDLKFDPRDGTLIGRVDPAGVGTQMSYDAFGRLLAQITPDDETRYSYTEGTPFGVGSPSTFLVGTRMQMTATDVTTGAVSTKGVDALGRTVQVESSGLDGSRVSQEFSYHWGTVLDSVTRTHLAGDNTQGEIDYSYDERFRLKERRFPDNTSISYLYAASANASSDTATEGQELSIAGVVDQRGHTSFQHRDFRGNSLRSVDEKGNSTRYVYDAFGTLGTITDAQGNVTTIGTDKLGRITSHQDADTGEQDRQYTAFNELFVFTDGVGTDTRRKRVYEYDDVGRLVTLTAPEGLTSFSYDQGVNATGRLVETSSPDGHAEHYDYEDSPANGDPMSNRAFLRTITRQIGASSFATGLSYNAKNELNRVDLPASSDGNHFAVGYEYDTVGHLKRVKGTSSDGTNDDALFWQRDSSFEGQAVAGETFGNGVTTSYAYDDKTGRLRDLTTKDPTALILQELKYLTYDNNGNIKTRSSSFLDVGSDTLDVFDESYNYDELDRLTTITEGKKASSVGYDTIGNITTKDGVGTYNYTEDGKVSRPHAVQNVSAKAGKVIDLNYDDFGNVIHRSGDGVEGESQDVSYSSFNLPTLVTLGTGAQVHYQYDAGQNRVQVDVGDCADQNSPTCNRRVYVGGAYERQSATDENGAFVRDLYKIFADGRQIAQVEREARLGTSTETRRYLHADHLGSSQLLTDETGKVASLRRFNAFGEALGTPGTDPASTSVRAGFTGHETDVETGLVNMRGRIYDPRLGRFLQADPPLSESPFWSQGLNRYSYAFNNPLRFTDPSGFDGEPEPPDDPPPDDTPDDPPPDDGSDTSQQPVVDCIGDDCDAAAQQANIERFERYDAELNARENQSGASSDPAQGDTEAMHEDSSSASNGTPGTPGGTISDEARRETYFTLGAGQGAVPFGTLGSDISAPRTARDRFDLGTGQLAGAATTLGESGTIAAAGGAEALTGIGIPFAIATELVAVVTAVGAATNAIEGIFNIANGDDGAEAGNGSALDMGKQGKHIPGHNNYIPGRSILTADPAKLATRVGTGQQIGNIPIGQAGSKEWINFGERIGDYIDMNGNATSTTNGIVHYASDGFHIVPAAP